MTGATDVASARNVGVLSVISIVFDGCCRVGG